ncbi:MAG: SDR family oxidoreductase [Longimicrobiales bacterium]
MAEKILVTGATGKVGRELVRRLVERRVEVKAATRQPERATGAFNRSVELVELDYVRTETYDAAVQWADRIFLTPPPFDPRADEDLVPFLDWAVSAGTQHLVLLSAMGADRLERLALRKVEKRVQRTGADWTILRPNWYMQNFESGFIAEEIERDGAFTLSAGAGEVSFVDVRDVADIATATLTSDDHLGRAYTLTGPEALDHGGAAALLSASSGREIRYVAISDDAMRERLGAEGWPDDQVEVLVGLLRSIREGERAAISPDVERVLGRPPRAFAAYAREQAKAWR